MAAFVSHEFTKGFLLNEERIRKINHIIRERLRAFDDDVVSEYKIYRADSFVYETSDVEDIIGEDNAEWQKVIRITVSAVYSDEISLELDFDFSGTTLRIEGSDRDNVYLLFSDLRQYLENEVNTIRRYPQARRFVPTLVLLIPLFFFSMFVFNFYTLTRSDEDSTLSIIESNDIHIKLNFLVESSRFSRDSFRNPVLFLLVGFISMALSLIVLLMGPGAIARPYRYLFPANLFLFGKESGRYEQRTALRGKVVWGVGITLLVSIVAGLVVNYFA